jgi:uncharacterized RDD family membrane protein YckC
MGNTPEEPDRTLVTSIPSIPEGGEQPATSDDPTIMTSLADLPEEIKATIKGPRIQIPNELMPAREVRVAPFWYRTVAATIDAIPLLTLYLLLLIGFGVAETSDLPQSQWNTFDMIVDLINQDPAFFMPPFALLVAVFLLYFLTQELLFGQSVGKRLLKLTVIDKTGERPHPIMLLIRNLVRPLGVAILGLGYLWAAFDPERRTLHDRVSGTWVIRQPTNE